MDTSLNSAPRVMIFEDDETQLAIYRQHCASLGLRPITVLCGQSSDAFTDSLPYDQLNAAGIHDVISRRKPDLVLTDYDFGVQSAFVGTDVARAIKQCSPSMPVILHSMNLNEDVYLGEAPDPYDDQRRESFRREAREAGADFAIAKQTPIYTDNALVREQTYRQALRKIGIDLPEKGAEQGRGGK